MRRRPWLILLSLLALLSLAACGDDDGGDPVVDPDPEPVEDSFLFYVYTLHDGGEELLRWIGTPAGPTADSPEGTERPWVGYGQPFRVEWRVTSAEGDITGYRYRVSVDPDAYLPSADTWGDVTSFTFQNAFAAGDLVGEDCEGGPECPEKLRLASGEREIEVIAIDETGAETDAADGLLLIEINYPPDTFLSADGLHECDDETIFPHYRAQLASGAWEICSFVEGDTIPAGATVVMELEGRDRLASYGYPDSFCCDTREDDLDPETTVQGRLRFSGVNDMEDFESFNTIYGPAEDATELSFRVAPFDYIFLGRAKDEHLRTDPTPDSLSFVAGFPPYVVSVSPHDGAEIILREADTLPLQFWPENEIPYSVSEKETRYWDIEDQRWTYFAMEGRIAMSGVWYQIPMDLVGAAHPREAELDPQNQQGGFVGSIRSWAYEWVGQYDPDNWIAQGAGLDDLHRFDSPFPLTMDRWLMEDEDGARIFVPDLFWERPQDFDPDGACESQPFCDIGAEMLKDLGVIQLTVVGKTTSTTSEWCQHRPAVVEDPDDCFPMELDRYGRRSEPVEVEFRIRLGLDDGSGNLGGTFPSGQ